MDSSHSSEPNPKGKSCWWDTECWVTSQLKAKEQDAIKAARQKEIKDEVTPRNGDSGLHQVPSSTILSLPTSELESRPSSPASSADTTASDDTVSVPLHLGRGSDQTSNQCSDRPDTKSLENQLRNKEQEIFQLTTELETCQKELQEVRDEKKSAEEKLVQDRGTASTAIQELQDKVRSLISLYREKMCENSELEGRITVLENERADLKRQLQRMHDATGIPRQQTASHSASNPEEPIDLNVGLLPVDVKQQARPTACNASKQRSQHTSKATQSCTTKIYSIEQRNNNDASDRKKSFIRNRDTGEIVLMVRSKA